LSEAPIYAAVDLGASSGRVIAGRRVGDRVELEEVHRFPNRPVRLPDGLHWSLPELLAGALEGLEAAAARGRLAGVGVDAWGVDYALLDGDGAMLGLPFHYRDNRTDEMVARAFGLVPAEELYAVTGTQTLVINTVFQLLAEDGTARIGAAERLALISDLVAYWLSGVLANESTAASTTGLLDARSGRWALDLVSRLGLPERIFAEVIEPGQILGPLLPEHASAAGLTVPPPVVAVAGHDTASAFAGAPVVDAVPAVLSSGTWSLLGLELPGPVLNDAAREANLTNERGVDGTTRLLRNVMGLWLLQECRRAWGGRSSFDALVRLAGRHEGEPPLFDPDDPVFLRPGRSVPELIVASASPAPQPEDVPAIMHGTLVSLACKYRWVLEHLERIAGVEVPRIHVVGGGARHAELCELTADLTGRPVLAGPVEAAALGNLLMQMRATDAISSRAEMTELAVASAHPVEYEPPADRGLADETYGRFLAVTGLRAPAAASRAAEVRAT
jgi:rhamnulokinase